MRTRPSSSVALSDCNSACLCCWPALQPGHHWPKHTLLWISRNAQNWSITMARPTEALRVRSWNMRCDSRHLSPLHPPTVPWIGLELAPRCHGRSTDLAQAPSTLHSPSGHCRRHHLRGPFGARRGAGDLAHRRRVEVREVAPAVAASWCGRLRPPPLTPRRGAGGHTRRRRVEVWEAAPAAANAPVKVREAAPAAAALRCGRRHPPLPRLHGRKAKLTSRHG